jgi:polyhydroxyalkanoate synthase
MYNNNSYSFELFTNNIVKSCTLYNEILDILQHKSDKPLISANSSSALDMFGELLYKLYSHPEQFVEHQVELSSKYLDIINNITSRFTGSEEIPLYQANPKDKRFTDEGWQDNLYFDFLKQTYLMYSNWANNIIQQVEFEDSKAKKKLSFYTQQLLDALSPSNFASTNPSVIREMITTNGHNIVKGLEQLLEDLKVKDNILNITTTAKESFAIGKNIAATKGKVIFQNDLMQLIHYTPLKKTNFEVPILIIPPFINKYYILDLSKENSFVKWLLEQNFSVFMISWINPDKNLSDKNFSNYMLEGPLAAIDAIQSATNKNAISAIGYCVGGTLLASTLAYMNKLNDNRIINSTFLTTLIDYSEVGDLSFLIDQKNFEYMSQLVQTNGYLDGNDMAAAFNLIRANDMIWSFYVNNYLLGKQPIGFDILYWNSDNTRLPAALYNDYIKNMYLNNLFKKPGGLTLNNIPIDLSLINIPTYMLSAKSDHIVPWKTTYEATKIFGKYMKFVLTTSGHVAGVVNHPNSHKYSYFVNDILEKTPEEWLEHSSEIQGSWWNNWLEWNKKFAGPLEQSLSPEQGNLKIIGNAPGTYVKMK